MSALVVRSAQTSEEVHQASDLIAKAHIPVYFDAMRWMETTAQLYPGYRRDHMRIALLNGEMAGALRVNSDTIRIGEARLRMGGFGWVTTAPRFRHKGVARELMRHTLRYLQQQRYHVSMLFGIPNFYDRFGFVTTLADYTVTVDVAPLRNLPRPAYRLRPGKPGDIAAVARIHNAHEGEAACSLLRTTGHMSAKWDLWKSLQVLTNDDGKVLAYFVRTCEREALKIQEAGAAAPAHLPALTHACVQEAQAHLLPRMACSLPPHDPFAKHLLQYRSVQEARLGRNEGGMMAVVDLAETFEALVPEWEHRLARSSIAGDTVDVTLLLDGQPYRVHAHHGAVSVVPGSGPNKCGLSMDAFVQLFTGYVHVDSILDAERRLLSPASRTLLHTMFPKRHPFVWPIDRF